MNLTSFILWYIYHGIRYQAQTQMKSQFLKISDEFAWYLVPVHILMYSTMLIYRLIKFSKQYLSSIVNDLEMNNIQSNPIPHHCHNRNSDWADKHVATTPSPTKKIYFHGYKDVLNRFLIKNKLVSKFVGNTQHHFL